MSYALADCFGHDLPQTRERHSGIHCQECLRQVPFMCTAAGGVPGCAACAALINKCHFCKLNGADFLINMKCQRDVHPREYIKATLQHKMRANLGVTCPVANVLHRAHPVFGRVLLAPKCCLWVGATLLKCSHGRLSSLSASPQVKSSPQRRYTRRDPGGWGGMPSLLSTLSKEHTSHMSQADVAPTLHCKIYALGYSTNAGMPEG